MSRHAQERTGQERTGQPGSHELVFDPMACPLLAGLSAEEQAERMENDPVIRACVRKLEGGVDQHAGCNIKRGNFKRSTGEA
jgi:hypothetical protein